MEYRNIIEGIFLRRPNRFIAHVEIDGREEVVHVKNTGRCKELLVPGCRVYLAPAKNPERKTKYDLVSVEKVREDGSLVTINMDSQIVNDVAGEWLPVSGLFSPRAIIRREVTYGKSRFDFYVEDGERKAFLEVKGCTLEQGGVAMFPDAPTIRGVKHIDELISCIENGFDAYILFVIAMKGVTCFCPNDQTHKAFGDALRRAQAAGVKILAMDCSVDAKTVTVHAPMEICLDKSTEI